MTREPTLRVEQSSETPSPKDAQVVGGTLPWKIGGEDWLSHSCCFDAVIVGYRDGSCVSIAEVREPKDAAFIVKAVNSHEANEAKIAAAVKALEWLIALASEMNDASNEGGQLDIRYDSAVATLSSLKEGK